VVIAAPEPHERCAQHCGVGGRSIELGCPDFDLTNDHVDLIVPNCECRVRRRKFHVIVVATALSQNKLTGGGNLTARISMSVATR
jgi:hypothetical protein